MPLSQISLVNLSPGISNPKIRDDTINQRRTLNSTRHLKIC
jgi:hypothetical protein